MLLFRVTYLAIWGAVLFLIFRHLARYGADQRQLNSQPHWWQWNFQTGWQSHDTTVSAYARQVHEHARLNDEKGARLTEHLTEREFQQTETETQAYTEQPPK